MANFSAAQAINQASPLIKSRVEALSHSLVDDRGKVLRAFRWIFRVGGQPVLSAPVSPAKGSATKSHFVVLDDRA